MPTCFKNVMSEIVDNFIYYFDDIDLLKQEFDTFFLETSIVRSPFYTYIIKLFLNDKDKLF